MGCGSGSSRCSRASRGVSGIRGAGRSMLHAAGEIEWSRAIADSSHVQAKTGLGRERWVVERTFAWLHNRRRLLLRTDRHHETHEAFLSLACCLICWRRLESSSGRVPCPADQGVRASWTYVMWLGRSSCAR